MKQEISSVTLNGLEVSPVAVEADVSNGLPNFIIVGLADTAVQESRERVRAAIKNSGFPFPRTRVTINLAPADIKKEGSFFDLPIALAILAHAVSKKVSIEINKDELVIGELSLSGEIRPVKGMLSFALFAKHRGYRKLILPYDNLKEASLIQGITLIPVRTLKDLISFLTNPLESSIKPLEGIGVTDYLADNELRELAEADFAYIRGQEHIKRALEIAAAGSHNVFLLGPPGAGKTLLAKALATILPPLESEEALEVTKIYSIAGLLKHDEPLMRTRPFRNPHHNTSVPALIGGGNIVKPGEISLAHRGVLFLDELGEFARSVLESLRQPIEEGEVVVARARESIRYPARFLLAVAQNPCPCGFYGDPQKACICTIGQVQKYHKKISGPLLDRIDMHLEVPAVKIEKLTQSSLSESSYEVRQRVIKARKRQYERMKEVGIMCNSELTIPHIRKFILMNKEAEDLLKKAAERLHLSARSYFRMMKLGKTIADLASEDMVSEKHIAEALQYRPPSYLSIV